MALRERAQVFEASQWGAESIVAPGVAVAADKRLEAISAALKPNIEVERYRPFGNKFDTLMIPGKDWTTVDVTGRLDYNNIIYPLASAVSYPTITTPGGGTNARLWEFESRATVPDTVQTYTVETGSPVRAQRATNVILSDLGFAFTRGSIEITATGIGKRFEDNIYQTGNAVYSVTIDGTVTGGTFTLTYSAQTTSAIAYDATAAQVEAALVALNNINYGDVQVSGGPGDEAPFYVTFTGDLGNQAITMTGTFTSLTAAPGTSAVASVKTGTAITTVTALPAIPGNVNVYVDTDFANIGTTKLTRLFEADVNIASRFNPMWVLDSDQTSFAATVEAPPDVTSRLKMAANGAGMEYLNTIRDGSTVYIRIESEGDAFAAPDASLNYLFRADMAAKIESLNDFGETDGAMSVDWMFRAVDDSDFGGAARFQVQNLRTAL
jgi:hypothetical protein